METDVGTVSGTRFTETVFSFCSAAFFGTPFIGKWIWSLLFRDGNGTDQDFTARMQEGLLEEKSGVHRVDQVLLG